MLTHKYRSGKPSAPKVSATFSHVSAFFKSASAHNRASSVGARIMSKKVSISLDVFAAPGKELTDAQLEVLQVALRKAALQFVFEAADSVGLGHQANRC